MRVAVVGAGVVGLAAASELIRAGAEVRCYEKAAPGSAQSKGKTRIFRQAHGNARLVELAMRARQGWRAWEERFCRRLVGEEGLIVTGEDIVPAWEQAMTAAAAPCRLLTKEQCRELLPIGRVPVEPALFDPRGGATRAQRTIELLRRDVGECLYRAEVLAIEAESDRCAIHSADENWICDEAVIAAGVDTNALASPLGLDLPVTLLLHSRFTFPLRAQHGASSLSCWIDDSGRIGPGWHAYGQPVGTTSHYAVGVSWHDQRCTLDVGTEQVSRESRQVATAYVREALPGLVAEPGDEIRCTYPEYAFFDHGDGFTAVRHERVTAFHGNNLFKFAPLLGQLLRDTVMQGSLAPELGVPAPARGL